MGSTVMDGEGKKKWYSHKWAVRLLLILFYPVGLYGFIRGAKPIITMILMTLLYGGFWTLIILTPYTPPEERVASTTETRAPNASVSLQANEPDLLYQAAERGDLRTVKRLLNRGETPYTAYRANSGNIENDDVDRDAYYIALQKGHFDIAEEFSKKMNRYPYWINRKDVISPNNIDRSIRFFINHPAYLPVGDVNTLINNFRRSNNNMEKENILIVLNFIAKADQRNNFYADFDIDLSSYLGSIDIWELVVFEDFSSLNLLAGTWNGLVDVLDQIPKVSADSPDEYTIIQVYLSMKFNRNVRKATDRYLDFYLSANYNRYLDKFIEVVSRETPIPQREINNVKRNFWNEIMAGVATKYNSEHITGETEVRSNFDVISSLKISAQAFESDFSKNIYMNANKTKLKVSVGGRYISNFLPVSIIEIELSKK
jgi:hypothetical protein